MPREPKPSWVAALKAVCGSDHDLRWNEQVGRWEFIIPGADGVPRSQFWGWFYRINADGSRTPIPPDPVTGLHPFRDLDDAAMQEALDNLQRSFIGNPYNGAGTVRREIDRRMRFNRDLLQAKYRAAGEAFADLAAERAHRLRGAPIIHVPVVIGGRGQREERAA